MQDFHLAQLSHNHTDAPGGILAALRGVSGLQHAFNMARYGNDDLTESAATLLADHHINLFMEHHWFVVLSQPRPLDVPSSRFGLRLLRADDQVDSDAVIAALHVSLPLLDNLESASIMIHVAAEHRRQGFGRALAALAEEVGRRRGRRIMQGYIETDADDGPDALMPRDGGQSIAQDAGTRFAQAMGYRLAQVERHSVQPVPMPTAPKWTAPDGYRLVSWRGSTPEEHLTRIAELQRVMSTDTPMGELEYGEELWDAARVKAQDAVNAASSELLTTMAVREPDDAPAGFTQLNRMLDRPTVGFQWNTLVAGADRGNGLGLALKLANLAQLAECWPDVERIHTWNAAENDHMWQINEGLGYQTINFESSWQKVLGE